MKPEHLQKYVDYIGNTDKQPLPVAAFDDDWSPIGPSVRSELLAAGLILEDERRTSERGYGRGRGEKVMILTQAGYAAFDAAAKAHKVRR